jgi:hypothetical protein
MQSETDDTANSGECALLRLAANRYHSGRRLEMFIVVNEQNGLWQNSPGWQIMGRVAILR